MCETVPVCGLVKSLASTVWAGVDREKLSVRAPSPFTHVKPRSLRSVAMNNSGKLTFRKQRPSAHLRAPKVPCSLPPCQPCQPFLLPDGGCPPRRSRPHLHRSSLPPPHPVPPRRPPPQSFLPSRTQTPHEGSRSCPRTFSEPLRERSTHRMKWERDQSRFSLLHMSAAELTWLLFSLFPTSVET